MSLSWRRTRAIIVKELQDYRRNRFLIVTMMFLPMLFIALPSIQILTAPVSIVSSRLDARIGISLLYMLLIPAFLPSVMSAYSVVGEREQGTLEPILTTPVRREEFLLAKALAIAIPTITIAYALFGVFLLIAALFAHHGIQVAVFAGSHLLVQLVFTPLIGGWSIWVGIAISARSSDVRLAQQLSVLASMPPLAVVALMNFNIISSSLVLSLGLAVALLLVDVLGWRLVAILFDRERLITDARS